MSRRLAQNYILIREENIPYFTLKILNRIKAYYRAKVILMRRDRAYQNVCLDLNDNLSVFQYSQMSSKQAQMRSRDSSAIFLNSYNFLEHVPTINRKPRAMVGLGVGALALIVEVKDKKRFDIRNLEVANGRCYDNGIRFTKNATCKASPLTTVFGDLHEMTHDRTMLARAVARTKALGVREIVLHDVFDAISINHHELHSSLFQINKMSTGVSLSNEIKSLATTLNVLAAQFKKVTVVESNHDNFLEKVIKDNDSLERCAEIDKIILYRLKAKMMEDILAKKGDQPTLKTLLDMHAPTSKNVSFLKQEDVEDRSGFIVSLHGDKGANGARFNYKSTTIPKSVTGHNHTGGYRNNNFSVGHLTDLIKQHYAKGGLSSWTYSMVDIYQNGTAQLITLFKGV